MKALSVIELAKLYGLNRQSIYKRINKGDLSKNSDGKIDFSEAIRIFGEPSQRNTKNVTLQSQVTQQSAEVDILKQQIDMLQKQLNFAQEREVFQREQLQVKDEQIEALQRLLYSPKLEKSIERMSESSKEAVQQTPTEDKPVEEKQQLKSVSLFSRVIRAMID